MAIPAGKPLRQIPVLVYHNVDPRFEFSFTRVTPRQFRSHLQMLADSGAHSITFQSVISHYQTDQRLPERAVVIAFDDAFLGVMEYALPLLTHFGFKCSVFPIVNYIGRVNTWDVNIGWLRRRHMRWRDLETLIQEGHEIGSHGMFHTDLTRLPRRELVYELQASRDTLQDHLGRPVDILSCPFGLYSDRVGDLAFSVGYTGISLIRQRELVAHPSGGYILPTAGIYRTTTLTGLNRIQRGMPQSTLSLLTHRLVGACAKLTPQVKRLPAYSLLPE